MRENTRATPLSPSVLPTSPTRSTNHFCFRAMWRQETIYAEDSAYVAAANDLIARLQGGFAASITDHDPDDLSASELLA